MAEGIELVCVCVCGENQKKAKALLLSINGLISSDHNFIFISKESSKNDLLYNLNLFIHVPST